MPISLPSPFLPPASEQDDPPRSSRAPPLPLPPPPRARSAPSLVAQAQLCGAYPRSLVSLYSHRLLLHLSELPGRAVPPLSAARAHVTSVAYDSTGELLASCGTDGRLCLHLYEQLLCGAAGCAAEHTQPLLAIGTGLAACALAWAPASRNELLCAYSNAAEVHTYDLAAKAVGTPSRVLRAAGGGGVHDALYLSAATVLAAGRDGVLRLWDVRAGGGAVVRQSAVTKTWTLGHKAEASRTGAINALAACAEEHSLYAATEEGCVCAWDLRALNTVRSVLRVAKAVGCASASVDALLAHRRRRGVLAFELAGGEVGLIDAARGAVLSHCAAATHAGSEAAEAAAEAAEAEAEGEAEAAPRVGAAGRYVRRRRGAWLCAHGGAAEEWLACGRPAQTGLALVREERHGALAAAGALASSAAVVAVAQHPYDHCAAVGMADNSVALLRPKAGSECGEEEEEEGGGGGGEESGGEAVEEGGEAREGEESSAALPRDAEAAAAMAPSLPHGEAVRSPRGEEEAEELRALVRAAKRAARSRQPAAREGGAAAFLPPADPKRQRQGLIDHFFSCAPLAPANRPR